MVNHMNTFLLLTALLLFSPHQAMDPWKAPLSLGQDPQIRRVLRETPGFWDGQQDERLLQQIQTAKIASISFNTGGSTISLRLRFTDGSSAAFKPDQFHEQTVPRYEIAAYHINRLLGLSRVPPATWRVITRRELLSKLRNVSYGQKRRILREVRFYKDGTVKGEVSHWIPVISNLALEKLNWRVKWMSWLKPYDRLYRGQFVLSAQISNMVLFDFIINNPDRFTGYNTMSTPNRSHLYYMDNTFSFYPNSQGSGMARIYMSGVKRFSKSLIGRLKGLTKGAIKRALSTVINPPWPLLTEAEIDALLKRRDVLMLHIVKSIAHYGWDKCVVFP